MIKLGEEWVNPNQIVAVAQFQYLGWDDKGDRAPEMGAKITMSNGSYYVEHRPISIILAEIEEYQRQIINHKASRDEFED